MAQGVNLVKILRDAGFTGDALKTAYAVAMGESGGNARAFNGNRTTGDKSYGLFQINMLGALGPSRLKQFGLSSEDDLYDPATNARVAYHMSQGGKNWQPWSAYKNGSYKKYLGGVPDVSTADHSAQRGLPVPKPPKGAAKSLEKLETRRQRLASVVRSNAQIGGFDAPDALVKRLLTITPEDQEKIDTQMRGGLAADFNPSQTYDSKSPLLAIPRSWQGTHVSDGLGWGTKTAVDIMAKAGTKVGSPVSGVVLYFHPKGAQGGGSMLIRGTDGKEYWLGHIDNGLKSGSAVKMGQPVASVSSDHANPHVHVDWRWLS